MAPRSKPSRAKPSSIKDVFAREVEPGLFVYSLDHRLPAATRKMVDRMVAETVESTRKAAMEIRQAIARRNGHAGELS